MKLSILICSLHKRKPFLDRLLKVLCPQVEKYSDVNVIINKDNGELIIGDKRNKLLEEAKSSEFLCFIDDDDLIADSYVDDIVKALETKPDCVGMEGIITVNNRNPKKFTHSIKYNSWHEKDGVYYRSPNHLNPIKTELALQIKFPSINSGEDQDFSNRILPLLKTEVYIDSPIYFYDYRTSK